jgi:hypothetical protein
MSRFFFKIKYILIYFFCGYFLSAQVKDSSNSEAFKLINSQSFKRHLEFLGSDLFEGRGTGTNGGNLTARYLALEFDKLNLKPIGANSTYYQYIPMHGSNPKKDSKLLIYRGAGLTELELWKDYVLYKTGEQTFTPTPSEMIFAGYGIVAPEFDYNDYQSINVEGKIVVLLEGEPLSENSEYFDGNNATIYSYPFSKQKTAFSRGARGSIIIPNHQANKYFNWEGIKREYSFEDVNLAYTVSSSLSIMINPESAAIFFDETKFNLKNIYDWHTKGSMRSFDLKTKLSFKGEFKRRDFVASNVIGLIEGSDEELRDSYIIVSAHYDHLGIGEAVKGDSIYNGVFDNAAGTAAVLELAKVFASKSIRTKRSIIFLLLTGEEKGLLGSIYYTDHPIKPLYKTIANINIDGVASFDIFKSIVAVGSEYSTLKNNIEHSAEKMNLSIVPIPSQFVESESFNRSDQIAFANAGIPSVLVLDAPDYVNISKTDAIEKFIYYNQNVYHTPFDDLQQPINYDAVNQHLELLFDIIYSLANSESEPEWNSGAPFINARLRSKAEKK